MLNGKLEEIDEILQYQPKRALDSLEQLSGLTLNMPDKAYYGLLLTIAYHKNHIPFTNDSLISESREWFVSKRDARNAARASFYHGLVLYLIASPDTLASHYMHDALLIMEGRKEAYDEKLIALANSYLGKINDYRSFNYSEAIRYYQNALDMEKCLDNPRNLILDYCDLLVCYVKSGQEQVANQTLIALDSTLAVHPDIKFQRINNAKAIYYLHATSHLDSALFYTRLWTPPANESGAKLSLLAEIYDTSGQLDSAISYEKKAYENKRNTDSLIHYAYLNLIADLYQRSGNADSAAHYALMAYRSLRDVMDERTEKRVLELEKQYDVSSREAALAKTRQQRNLLIVAVCALVLLLASFLRQRFMQKKQRAAETMANSVIYAAARTHQNTLSQLKELQRKPKFRTVESLQDNISVITKDLRRGFTQHFSEALANNLASLPPHIRQSVEKLSGERAKIVYILTELGYSESEIAEFTCSSIDSVRTIGNNNEKVLS